MINPIKKKIKKASSCNVKLNKKVLCLLRSWNEVYTILNKPHKRKEKKKLY